MNGDVLDLSGYYGGPHAHCFSCHSFVLCPKTATIKSSTGMSAHLNYFSRTYNRTSMYWHLNFVITLCINDYFPLWFTGSGKAEDNDWCDFTTCPKCAWVYHGCKAEEHVLLCEREIVKCINAGLGCPFKVQIFFIILEYEKFLQVLDT